MRERRGRRALACRSLFEATSGSGVGRRGRVGMSVLKCGDCAASADPALGGRHAPGAQRVAALEENETGPRLPCAAQLIAQNRPNCPPLKLLRSRPDTSALSPAGVTIDGRCAIHASSFTASPARAPALTSADVCAASPHIAPGRLDTLTLDTPAMRNTRASWCWRRLCAMGTHERSRSLSGLEVIHPCTRPLPTVAAPSLLTGIWLERDLTAQGRRVPLLWATCL